MLHRLLTFATLIAAGLLAASCYPLIPDPGRAANRAQRLVFDDLVEPRPVDGPIALRAARNETVSFALRINSYHLSANRHPRLKITPLKGPGGGVVAPEAMAAYEIVDMPVDTNRAGFVRQTGLEVARRQLPRALLPLRLKDGKFILPPRSPSRPGEALGVWVDVRIATTLPPGEYKAECQLGDDGGIMHRLPVTVTVHDFVIPDERHLAMVGEASWETLLRLYPQRFANINPRLLSRLDNAHTPAVQALDALAQLAHEHRVEFVVPRLQPTAKWPAGQPVQLDWTEFDSVAGPWLSGEAFADRIPQAYWPLPYLDEDQRLGDAARLEYFLAAAAHFDSLDWLDRSSVELRRRFGGRADLAEAVALSEQAARILSAQQRLRVLLPLEEEQVQLASAQAPGRIPPAAVGRVIHLAAGVVARPPLQELPDQPGSYLRTAGLPGLPYAGAGTDEYEVRQWAWLAFLRGATMIQWASALPAQNAAAQAADPGELVWFYPGEWFGLDRPVPTLQLKWLRRAQFDYEHLWLARQRGQGERASTLARLIVRPVELGSLQSPEPVHALLAGSGDRQVWQEAIDLLTRSIILATPGQPIDPAAEQRLHYDLVAWSAERQKPRLIPRSLDWLVGGDEEPVGLSVGWDVHNSAGQAPSPGSLRWQHAPTGWSVSPDGKPVPPLRTDAVGRTDLEARIDADKLRPSSREPAQVSYIDGQSGRAHTMEVVAPAAWSDLRTSAPPRVDGSLGDWTSEDALHDGRLVRMLSRPLVQRQALAFAPTASSLYSTWTGTTLYLGFKVDGADVALSNAEKSFVDYDFGRAWGEDVCQFMIQPLYRGGAVGPLLLVSVKPRGQLEISRRLDPKESSRPWQAFAGTDVRYAANLQGSVWRGEISIPWDALRLPDEPPRQPVALRLNFVQHQGSTGQSATWAGPVDTARDERFMGLLLLRR